MSSFLSVLHLHPGVIVIRVVITDTAHKHFAVLDTGDNLVEVELLVVSVSDVAQYFVTQCFQVLLDPEQGGSVLCNLVLLGLS